MSSCQVLSLPPVVAPTKVLIVPLSAKEEFDPLIREVCTSFNLVRHGQFSLFGDSVEAAQGGDLLTGG
jgi:glycyl-tRNA synthetase